MFLVSLAAILPVVFLAVGGEIPSDWLNQFERAMPADRGISPIQLAVSFSVGLVLAGTPLHNSVRYLTTVVHELGHAFTAGVLGGRPRNIIISLDASGVAVYETPSTWGRGRASLVSFAGYPAPAVASLAAVEAVRLGYSRTWFTFAAVVIGSSIILLVRNLWGFVWCSAVAALSYLAATNIAAEYLGFVVGVVAGYLALEGIRNVRVQLSLVRHHPGNGSDAERIAGWWKLSPTFVAVIHVITVSVVSGYAASRAVGPQWFEMESFLRGLFTGS